MDPRALAVVIRPGPPLKSMSATGPVLRGNEPSPEKAPQCQPYPDHSASYANSPPTLLQVLPQPAFLPVSTSSHSHWSALPRRCLGVSSALLKCKFLFHYKISG